MSAAHTPGPWIVEADGSMLEVCNEETLYTVARVFRHEQNARLIAAAPDLLRDLRFASKLLHRIQYDLRTCDDGEGGVHDLLAVAEQFDATIASAEGRS